MGAEHELFIEKTILLYISCGNALGISTLLSRVLI